MSTLKTSIGRRNFLKSTALVGGGMMLGFNWLLSCQNKTEEEILAMPDEWFEINSYLKIGDNGVVTIYTPNPEFGQNVRTSMPMLIAEELDIDWKNVLVEQAPYHPEKYGFQFTGGSQGIKMRWEPLRMAGATARQMLCEAAAQAWQVPVEEITTEAGVLRHKASGKSAGYGEMASAAAKIPVPKEVKLKEVSTFKIIGKSHKNVDGKQIITGQPMFGSDYYKEGMLIAMIAHPPAFGLTLKSVDDTAAKEMPGIKAVVTIKSFKDDFVKGGFDTNAFPELVAIVGNSTWEVMQAKKKLNIEWKPTEAYTETINGFRGTETWHFPAGLESTENHKAKMNELATKEVKRVRKDGNPEEAFKNAAKIIERSYSAPFLSHNSMEPLNAFAHVEGDKVKIAAPIQIPSFIVPTIASSLEIPVENIEMELLRMGGGFGRKAYGHYVVEAALISKKVNAPVKLIYTREDDMTNGVYRPTYHATYRAALDENNNLTALHIKAGGIPESPLFANRFPAGAIDNYLAEEWSFDSNITIGTFRAPRSNFMAGAEQSFLDEVAEATGKDPIQFRLDMLKRAKENPIGEQNDYDAERYAGILELVREKSGWGQNQEANVHRGVSAYFCHDSYVAHVLDLKVEDGKPTVQKVCCAIDCGIVVNPDAAKNMAEGAIIDGIGNAFYGEMTFKDGMPQKTNFDQYRMIRMNEAPKEIEVHFVENEINPTGMGEPPFPPIFGAVANALYKATGERHYHQPFLGNKQLLG